jgi:hypothetical protein
MPMSNGEDDHRRLQPFGCVEGLYGMIERLFRIGREQQHVARVAMRRVGAGHQIRLLGARGHAGGRAATLHIENDRGNFREVAITQELVHQRYSRTAGRRE